MPTITNPVDGNPVDENQIDGEKQEEEELGAQPHGPARTSRDYDQDIIGIINQAHANATKVIASTLIQIAPLILAKIWMATIADMQRWVIRPFEKD